MLHIGLQVKDRDELEKMEKLLKDNLGIKSFMEFEKEKSGMYLMSVEPIKTEIKEISDFTDEELKEECEDRNFNIF